jgi:hypothetical protein
VKIYGIPLETKSNGVITFATYATRKAAENLAMSRQSPAVVYEMMLVSRAVTSTVMVEEPT